MKSILFCLSAVVLGAAALGGLGEGLGSALQAVVGSALDTTGRLLTGDDFSKILFILYTNSRNASYPIDNATDLLADSDFDATKPTVLYMHGWQESNASESVGVLSRAFLQRGSHNFILVDWSEYVKGDYVTSFLCVTPAGEAVGAAVNRMVDAGLDWQTLWTIGHSLGGQLSGVFAKNLNFKPNRITALDPAGPGFDNIPMTPELTRDDAVMVDVIHTDAGIFGSDANDGTIDLWPNGGTRVQPGCDDGLPNVLSFCSHHRSWKFFAESVKNEFAFPAVSCPSWLAFESGLCPVEDSNIVYMGFAAPATDRAGTFFLRTASETPFGLGVNGTWPASAVDTTTTTTTTEATTTTTEATTTEAVASNIVISIPSDAIAAGGVRDAPRGLGGLVSGGPTGFGGLGSLLRLLGLRAYGSPAPQLTIKTTLGAALE